MPDPIARCACQRTHASGSLSARGGAVALICVNSVDHLDAHRFFQARRAFGILA